MKLVRYSRNGQARLGAVKGDGIIDLGELGMPTMLALIAAGAPTLARAREIIDAGAASIALSGAKLLAPIERPGKYLAIGMNYKNHLQEAARLGVAAPTQHQIWFNKQTTCICGPHDDIDPGVTQKLDYEVELGVVIGRTAKRIEREQAMNYIFGYFVANDVSARDWQFHSPTVTLGKSFDTHGPIGPWLVTADEIPDPQALSLRCMVNGQVRQSSNTEFMLHPIHEQIAYLSTAFTLEIGDLIATGTPEGVGIAMQPPQFLQPGDVVRCEIDGIGAIENRVRRPNGP